MYYDCGQAIVPMYYDTKEFDLRMSHGVELVRLVAAARCAHVGTSEFFGAFVYRVKSTEVVLPGVTDTVRSWGTSLPPWVQDARI